MIHINAVPLDFEPRGKILSKLSEHWSNAESLIAMSEFESAFLCGALKTFRPKKILEVGVLDGGSTSVILQALEDIGEPYEMHSVDRAAERPFKKGVETGFAAKFVKENILSLRGTHEFHLGKVLAQVIDEIGGGIDFVVLDTVHALPGEILDAIAVLPYLKAGSVVVLHDVAVNQINFAWHDCFSNAALFSALTAEKFLNFDKQNFFRYPNIGAFRVSKQTVDHIDNVFLSLILPWHYLPPKEELVAYLQLYRRFYPAALCEIFQEAINMNVYNFALAQRKNN
ncbi:MAG: class I SAM-dependent methyltransferase [Selenomonadaceae bacterium]|nr:class I SAM-dependent methyltransferase [Selenomonadaceae bacterium]MBQ3726279.1 class I SAM-dependent methyltransferase [Selenomonadaceae bacterium]MBQ9496447.1 class I SAM-dependent methyltransferase [Selenomonadaceae bacterium]